MDTHPATNSFPPAGADDLDDCDQLKHFVEHYLQSRGIHLTTRNARVVVATLAACRPATLEWSALERHLDASLNRDMLRPAA